MQQDGLYTLGAGTETDSVLLVPVTINSGHPVFAGHFPGQPVLPGVCMLDMIQDILERRLDRSFRLAKGPLIKFLAMIVPEKNPDLLVEVKYKLEGSRVLATGKIFYEALVFMKYNLEFIPEPV